MKTIKIILFPILLLLFTNVVFGQDEFYNSTSKKNNQEQVNEEALKEDYSSYTTAQDYELNNMDASSIEDAENEFYDEEIYQEEKRKERRRRANAEFVAQVFFDVIVNTAFIVATFWQ